MKDLDENISPELQEAVRRFGFNKVAAKMYGVEEINEKTASTIIGEKLMTRVAEQRQISTGLAALKDLEKSAYVIADDLIGGGVGYNYGKQQKDRGERYSFGIPQAASLLLPGGAGYQVGRAVAHGTGDKKNEKKKDEKKKDKE